MSTIKIEIRDEQRKSFIDFLKIREQEVQQEIKSLEDELHGIRVNLRTLGINGLNGSAVETPRNTLNNNPVGGDYRKNWTQVQKVIFLLKKVGHPASTGELADLQIKEYEPELDRGKAVGAISATLTSKSTRKLFARSQNERNQNVYTLLQN
jgi:hypothetical protein